MGSVLALTLQVQSEPIPGADDDHEIWKICPLREEFRGPGGALYCTDQVKEIPIAWRSKTPRAGLNSFIHAKLNLSGPMDSHREPEWPHQSGALHNTSLLPCPLRQPVNIRHFLPKPEFTAGHTFSFSPTSDPGNRTLGDTRKYTS
jgi:hypothetical protein